MGDFSILANRIKELRHSVNMTQREFAKEAGFTAATLSAYENGSKSPSLEIIMGIAKRFDVSIDWLCGLSEQKNNKSTSFETYSNIIETLLNIDSVLQFNIVNGTGFFKQLEFDDIQMNNFLGDLSKFKTMLKEKTIDNDIYQACIEKLLRDSALLIDQLPFN